MFHDPRARFPVLDHVRAASIALVVLGHTAPLGPAALELNSAAAKLGLALFFCLSGFLVTRMLYLDQDVFRFLVRRTFRIVPAMYLYVLVLFVLYEVPVGHLLLQMSFAANYFPWALGPGPASHLWSLCVEMQFYAFAAALVLLMGRAGLWLIPVCAVAVTALRVDLGVYKNIATHLRVDEILAGGCLALLAMTLGRRLSGPVRLAPARAWALLGAILALWVLTGHQQAGAFNYARPYATALLVGFFLFVEAPLTLPGWLRALLAYGARISYAVYIWHMLAIAGAMNRGSAVERYLIKRPVSYAFTLAAAHVSTVWWEAWWQARAREIAGRGRLLGPLLGRSRRPPRTHRR